jgi:hypothetical protein
LTIGRLASNRGARPVADRIARIVVVIASAWYAFTAAWGMFGIPGGGHLGAGTLASIMASEHVLRWKMPYATWDWYTATAPDKSTYACHHPYGLFYLPVPLLWLFGHHDFVAILPAVLINAAIPPLLYGIAKERWGAPAGAVAAAAYVVVPLAVGYSNFWGLEPLSIFGALLFFWGHSRHMTTRKQRHLVASLVGAAIACSGDWIGYVIVGLVLGWSALRAFVLPSRLTPRFHFEPYARWWALAVAITIGTLVLWLGIFYEADHITEWLSAGTMRSVGTEAPLKVVLESRKNWIDFSFTPLAILVGKIAAPVCLLRVVLARRDEEVYAPALLVAAVGQYVAFKQGADIHIFWPLYFAPYFALALAQLVATVGWVVGAVARHVARAARSRERAVVAGTVLVLGLAPVLAMAHDGVLSLWIWRRTGGRYDDRGTLIRSDVDALAVMKQVIVPHKSPGTLIDVHPSYGWYWHHDWQWQGKFNFSSMPVASGTSVATHPLWIARASGMSSEEQRKIAHDTHVRVYGDTWIVDQREPPGSLDAYSMNEREPNPLEWLLFGGTEPMRTAGTEPDPWLTWEWRTSLGQDAPPPTGEPKSIDEMRIAHNAAIALGDAAIAEKWRERIDAQIDRTVQSRFDPGLQLIGVRVVGGVQPRVESWFEVTAAPTGDALFAVRSKVEQRAPMSLVPADTYDRDMAYLPSLPTKLWRPGAIYKTVAVMNHRIGSERYLGRWVARGSWGPQRADGALETTLAILP